MEGDGCRIRERRGAPCQQQQPCPNATTTRARLVLCDVRPGRGFERRVQAFAPGVLWCAGRGGVAAIGTTVSTVRALRSSLLC
jgi:hypothetical protein